MAFTATPKNVSVFTHLTRLLAAAAPSPKPPDLDKINRIAQAEYYPIRAWYCILALLVSVSICHFSALAYRLTRGTRGTRAAPAPAPAPPNGTIVFSRLHLALVNAFRALAFRTSINIGHSYVLNPAEVFVGAAYIAVVFSWSLVNTTSIKGVKFDPGYYANMASNLAALQLPLVAALGSKNNIISLLTGISYNKLNFLHRMCARVLCVLIWVHASGRIRIGFEGSLSLDHTWIRCGIMAASSLTILSLVSIRPIRKRNYEVFRVVHFLLVFIILLGGYFHARGIDAAFHVWPAFIVWGLDRLIRGIRIIMFNFGYINKKTNSIEHSGCIEVLSERFVRIIVRRPGYVHWLPGQSAYLTIPNVTPFETHPFTISSIDVLLLSQRQDQKTKKQSEGNDDSSDGSSSSSFSGSESLRYKELMFIARVKSGFTKRLLAGAEGREQNVKVIIDGPYGSPPLLRGFETVVLIAGGSGITFTLPLFLDILHRHELKKNDCTRVCFIWAIRDAGHIEWIADAILPALLTASPGITIDFRVYVTAAIEDDLSSSSKGYEEVKIDSADLQAVLRHGYPGIELNQGRPDLGYIVDEEIRKAAIGAISFNVCGSTSLAHSVRSALRRPRFMDVLKGGPVVDLHVESFEM